MKAAVIKKRGVIEIERVPVPEPGNGEVLLKVEACALCGTDQRVLAGEKHVDVPIIGHEIIGSIAEIGQSVKNLKASRRYVVQTVIGCGKCPMCLRHRENLCEKGFVAMGYQFNGGFAEYVLIPKVAVDQGCLIPVPDSLPADVGTLIEPLSCCVNGMNYIPLADMEHVIVFGGGIIGVLNGLFAKNRGARKVTIVDISQERLDLLRKLALPFDNLVNSSVIDIENWVKKETGESGVDAVIIAASVKSLVPQAIRLLKRSGHLSVFAGMPKSDPVIQLDLNKIHYLELNLHGANSSSYAEYLTARDLLVSGQIDGQSLITHHFALDDFNKAVSLQKDPTQGALKIVIIP